MPIPLGVPAPPRPVAAWIILTTSCSAREQSSSSAYEAAAVQRASAISDAFQDIATRGVVPAAHSTACYVTAPSRENMELIVATIDPSARLSAEGGRTSTAAWGRDAMRVATANGDALLLLTWYSPVTMLRSAHCEYIRASSGYGTC